MHRMKNTIMIMPEKVQKPHAATEMQMQLGGLYGCLKGVPIHVGGKLGLRLCHSDTSLLLFPNSSFAMADIYKAQRSQDRAVISIKRKVHAVEIESGCGLTGLVGRRAGCSIPRGLIH